MILIPVGKKLVRSSIFRIDNEHELSDRFYFKLVKNSKSRKERIEELRRCYEAQEKALARSER